VKPANTPFDNGFNIYPVFRITYPANGLTPEFSVNAPEKNR
jgi:hypothetical protein